MNQRFKVLHRTLIAYHQAAEVLQPGVRALDNPPPLVAAQLAPILVGGDQVSAAARDNGLDGALDQQSTGGIAIVAPVGNQPQRLRGTAAGSASLRHGDSIERALQERDLRRGCLLHAYSERSTRAICQNHTLCPLTAFGRAHTLAPFLATTNVPSTKHSFRRIFLVSLSWSRKARHKLSRTPVLAHWLSRRCTALLEPYRSGNSLHGAPVHKIHKIPSKHWRSLKGGRPPRRRRLRLGNWAAINCHCLSVTARQAIGLLLGLASYAFSTTCQRV